MARNSSPQRFEVPASLAGRPLDRALRTLAELSWGDARALIARGKVEVAGVVTTVADREARIAQTDHLIDIIADRSTPIRDVRSSRPSKSEIRCDDETSVVSGVACGAHKRPRDDEVPSFNRGWTGSDDGEDGHVADDFGMKS